MTDLQNTFLNMIRTTLWDEPFQFEESVTPWDIYNEACRYELAGITWEKRELFCAGDAVLRRQWLKTAAAMQKKSRSIIEAQSALGNMLAEAGIRPVFIKGIATARFYPHPMQRHAGDIDFIVLPEQYDKACEIMEQSGYERGNDNHRHVSFEKDGVEFECHRFFTPTGQGQDEIREKVLMEGCRNCVETTVEGKRFFTLPDAEYGIMHLEHLTHHISYGIGFRQYIDWILYINAFAGDEEWISEFEVLLKECNLERLAKVMTRTAQLYLGLDSKGMLPCSDVDSDTCDKFLAFLFTCDDFGFTLDANETTAHLSSIMRFGFFKKMDEQALLRMPIAGKVALLRPAAWTAQLAFWSVKGIRGFVLGGDKLDLSKDNIKEQKQVLKDIGV